MGDILFYSTLWGLVLAFIVVVWLMIKIMGEKDFSLFCFIETRIKKNYERKDKKRKGEESQKSD